MSFTDEDKMTVGGEVQQHITHTSYACTSLTILNGGTANFIFRGILAQPLPNHEKTVVIKHSRDYVSANRSFALDVSRCKHEVTMLNAMAAFEVFPTENISIRSPRLYHFDDARNTQILEDLSGSVTLTASLISNEPFLYGAFAIGKALGIWLRSFHSWSADARQAHLRRSLSENSNMRKVRYDISYGAFVDVLKKFPEIWEVKGQVLEDVKDMATDEYARGPFDEPDTSWGIIHGDFWSGNVLLPHPNFWQDLNQPIELFVIDWEMTQYGRREYDLGQMIGDCFERKIFDNAANALQLIHGFVNGYGPLSEQEAFRIAIHAGQHLVCWYIRRDQNSSLGGLEKQVAEAMRIGSHFIVNGWTKDREWFTESDVACLFTDITDPV